MHIFTKNTDYILYLTSGQTSNLGKIRREREVIKAIKKKKKFWLETTEHKNPNSNMCEQ